MQKIIPKLAAKKVIIQWNSSFLYETDLTAK